MNALDVVGIVAVALYGLSTTFLAGHGLHTLWLLARFRRHRPGPRRATPAASSPTDLPIVLVQLPVFNERDVVARLVAAIGAFDWPADRLRIQLLDDSTDDSVERGRLAIDELVRRGLAATHVRREHRTGFKAGALAHGLELDAAGADGGAEFVAIFDADFVPTPDFLRRALATLQADRELAFVQGRWEHLNPDHSLLTRAQAIGIDGHFAIEQAARAWSSLPLNFNGTCGVWRRAAIEDSGGWQHDTLTEDLDLSYRAWLHGWRAAYDLDLAVPGELPPTLEAWRAQQFRWAKGSLQTAQKLLPSIWRSPWSAVRKFAATMHLTHYLVHPAMVVSLTMAPLATLLLRHAPTLAVFLGTFLLLAGLLPPLLLYIASQRVLGRAWSRLLALPALMSFGTGIALSNTRAAWQALSGARSPFERTPKHGAGRGSYRAASASGLGELGLAALGGSGLFGMWRGGTPWLFPIVALYVLGYLVQGLQLLRSRLAEAMPRATPDASTRWWLLLGLVGVGAMTVLAGLTSNHHWHDAPWSFAGAGVLLGGTCFAATMLARRTAPTPAAMAIVLLASGIMMTLATSLPLSDDVHRYAVEGAQIGHGENPYAIAPAATAAIDLHSLGGPVNHAPMTSIYPPLMLWVHGAVMALVGHEYGFRYLAIASMLALLLLSTSLLLTSRRAPTLVVAIAWNPVLLLFAAGEAHHDVVAAVALLLAFVALRHRRSRTCILLASIAVLLKPFAIAALPALLLATSFRHVWIPALTAALAYLPFVGAGEGLFRSLLTFGNNMQFHGALEPLLRQTIGDHLADGNGPLVVRMLLAAMLLGGFLWLLRRSSGELPASRAARGIALLLLCLPTLHPWYFTLLVVLLPFTHSRALLAWTVAAPLYWLHGVGTAPGSEWAEWPWATTLAHVPFLVWMFAEAFGPLRIAEPRLDPAVVPHA